MPMPAASQSPATVRELHSVAAELDQATREIRAAEARVAATIGSTATGADKQMLVGLQLAASSARGAQQALSAAATALANPAP
jgi:hypothetical protein